MTRITAIWETNGKVYYRTAEGEVVEAGVFPHALSRYAYEGDVVLEGTNEYGAWTSSPDLYDRKYPHEYGALLELDDLVYVPSPLINYLDIETTELWGDVELVGDGSCVFGSEALCASIDDEPAPTLSEMTDAEATVVGYNLFNYDLQVIQQRLGDYLGIEGFAVQQFRYGGDTKDVYVPKGDREYIDLYLQVLRWDVENGGRLSSHGLKSVVEEMGLRKRQGEAEWTAVKGDTKAYVQYLLDDILDTAALGDALLPVLLSQAQILPCRLTHIGVMGTGQKVDALLVGTYIKHRHSVPRSRKDDTPIQGALVEAQAGVYRGVVAKADFASMYPSIIINEHLVPQGDVLEAYPKWMRYLRDLRLKNKKSNPTLSAALKILINSFYGYTGSLFPFSDRRVANAITAKGRELVRRLKGILTKYGTHINTDTDGVLVLLREPMDAKELERIINTALSPYQVEVELYDAALVIAMKNYILAKGGEIKVVKGNSLRNRADEPFLQDFIRRLLWRMLNEGDLTEDEIWDEIKRLIPTITPENAFQRKRVGKHLRTHHAHLVEDLEDGAKVDLVHTPTGVVRKDEATELDLSYYLQRVIKAIGRFGGRYEAFAERYNKKQALQQRLDELGIPIAVLKRRKQQTGVLV